MIEYFDDIALISSDRFISKWIKEHGRLDFDNNSLPQILPYIKEGDIVVDAGAYIGDHTLAYARAVGSTGRVIAFEPDPVAFQCLEHNLKKYKNVGCNPYGLTEKGDYSNYVIDYNIENPGASFLKQNSQGSRITTSLDDYLYGAPINFIKIDCEGMELKILKGASSTIKFSMPILVIEINQAALERQGHTPQMVFDFLDEMNYIYRNIYEEQPMEGLQYDILAFPK